MHSKRKLQQHYPDLSEQDLKHFYGFSESPQEKSDWERLAYSGKWNMSGRHDFQSSSDRLQMDLKIFYEKTAPMFFMYLCVLNDISCLSQKGNKFWEKDLVNDLPSVYAEKKLVLE